MSRIPLRSLALLGLLAGALQAQHSQTSAIAVDPADSGRVWVANRDNHTVSLVDVPSGAVVSEIPVGFHPRSVALSADGARLFVANQRGTVSLQRNFVIGGFTPADSLGTVSVIDTNTLSVQTTLTHVGVEPYGLAVAPNGKYFAVSGFRSGTIKLYDAASLLEVASLQYPNNLNFVPPGLTVADVDEDIDGLADLGEPRGFTIRADSQRIYVTHNKSPYVSVLDVTLSPRGVPVGLALAAKIDTNDYPFDTFRNPVPVQVVQSQGLPRFLEDIALSPDGGLGLVPHLLHNINHDVNHDFGGAIPGDFANRVYPALTVLDLAQNSYGQPGDASARLHNEWADPTAPAEYASFGVGKTMASSGNPILLGGVGSPVLGGQAQLVVSGWRPGDTVVVLLGNFEANVPLGSAGTLRLQPRFTFNAVGGTVTVNIPNQPSLDGFVAKAQALVTDGVSGEQSLSNLIKFRLRPQAALTTGKMGHRAGHPSRVRFSPDGQRVLMLNRGSEDVFLYDRSGSDLVLRSVYPPRLDFAPRAPLDETTPLGDVPMGMALVADAATDNDDALVYVLNEGTRTLSTLRVDWTTGAIQRVGGQIKTITGTDTFTFSERLGFEIFEDASRSQTTGNFNNSCASCHFEGGDDANVWQRPSGPRSTMPVYGGTLGTGLFLWKAERLHMGETGPMFGGENGGHGIFTPSERQSLIDYHEQIAFPLNPNLDPVSNGLTPLAELGQDLFFGTNDTGLNPTGRSAGCATCHPRVEIDPFNNSVPRFFTVDVLLPELLDGSPMENFDPDCFSLRENIIAVNIRNVNSGVNVDMDEDGFPDLDRNFDGFPDVETYTPMNPDSNVVFARDDPNSYLCPCDPINDPNCDPLFPFRSFTRSAERFSIPTKLGVFSTAPYFHDHAAFSLRAITDPAAQMDMSPGTVYGNGAYNDANARPGLMKSFNEFHDIRGHGSPFFSKVQTTLNSTDKDADIEAILAFIQSL